MPCVAHARLDSSPIRYDPSSSPNRRQHDQRSEVPQSTSSNLFVRSTLESALNDEDPSALRNKRGDINSEFWSSSATNRRRRLVNPDGMPPSDTATFSNLNPNTSDADAYGGRDGMVVWGTNISLQDTSHAFGDFLRNFRKKYRMIKDGEIEEGSDLPADHGGNEREYDGMMKMMLEFGVTALNLDMRNLKAYPPTTKLWYQMQNFPEEVIPIVDTVIKDAMIELAEKKMKDMRDEVLQQHNRRQGLHSPSSSVAEMPSSDIGHDQTNGVGAALQSLPNLVEDTQNKIYRVRPFGLDQAINLRELNPGGMQNLYAFAGGSADTS